MNYAVLKTELDTDPLERGYSGMTDTQVASSLNTVDREIRQLVPLWLVKKTAIENQCWLPIVAAAASHAVADVQGAAVVAIDYVNDQRFENLDMDLASTQAMIGALVAGEVITQDQADILDALADSTISRATELGLEVVRDGDVQIARS